MHRYPFKALATALVAISAVATAFPDEATTVDLGLDVTTLPVEVEDFEGIEGSLFKDGRVLIGEVPEPATLLLVGAGGLLAVMRRRRRRRR